VQVQVQTCWEVGRHIVESEQGGENRATYGKKLLSSLAENLTREFGKGFDASNLRYMLLFYRAFPMCEALRHTLSRTSTARYYAWRAQMPGSGYDEAAAKNWSSSEVVSG